MGNGVITTRSIDPVTGLISKLESGLGGGNNRQNETYLWDKVGNLTQRQSTTISATQTENFYYDNLYRLDYSTLNGATNLDMSYDALGRITNRSDVASNGAWTYGDVKHLHAPTKTGSASLGYNYDNNGNATSRNGKAIGWDAYNFPATINNSSSEYINFYYDGNHARWKSVYVNGTTTETTINVGDLKGWIWRKVVKALRCLRWAESDIGWC